MISLPVRFKFQQRRPEWIEAFAQCNAEYQSVQIFQRQRAQQQRVDCAKDRRVRTDAYGERRYSDGSVGRTLQQNPCAVADILPEFFKHKMSILFLGSDLIRIRAAYSSLVVQGSDWIDACRAPGRQKTRSQGRDRDHHE